MPGPVQLQRWRAGGTAPDIFSFDDDDRLVYEAAPSDTCATTPGGQPLVCPMRAVTVTRGTP
ncbi:hypothetical protein [Streptomyces sp. NPDC003023]|uniref:hypothetical protein n=1 Tax=Streptomyces sp. NPDC003023 TaxID=3364675 RepID=UPI0036C8492A